MGCNDDTASFKIGVSKVQEFEDFELSLAYCKFYDWSFKSSGFWKFWTFTHAYWTSILFQHFLVYLQTVLTLSSRREYSAGEAVNTISYVRGRVILVLQLFDKINPDKVNKPVRYTRLPPGRVAQSVTCLATDACLTADPGVASSIPARPILSWRLIMK